MKKLFRLLALCVLFLAQGCGTYFNQPLGPSESRVGEATQATTKLIELPPPAERLPVGVYNFRDLTGQYKASATASTFSTAVTQGSTAILIKALSDSKWFRPLERENLSNLLQERNIIKQTREEARRTTNPNEPRLPGLLFAGILIEGGIVSYDTNIVTGGLGARYFGIGGSTQYRQDRVTIYLRAVSTTSGEILKNIYVSKTILSQSVDASLFRYVNFQRLLEVETGFTKNEPVQLAIQEAIETAVRGLIIEGIQDRRWSTSKGTKLNQEVVDQYIEDKEFEETVRLYDRVFMEDKAKTHFDFTVGPTLFDGDLANKEFGGVVHLGYTTSIGKSLDLNFNAKYLLLRGGTAFEESFTSTDVNLEYDILPTDNFAPYIYGGVGYLFGGEDVSAPKVQYGLGLTYKLSDRIGLKLYAEHNLTFNDDLEAIINGRRDDFYFNFGFGLRYSLLENNKKDEEEDLPVTN
jgi:curli production assembly/transport component CsgG